MTLKDIAKKGLKGRKKDTFLINIIIILSFIFITTSTIFQASIDKTRLEQRFDLYGEWHAAYLGGNKEVLEVLNKEIEVDKIGTSLMIGESDTCGLVGTFNQDLLDLGRFTLYEGRYPQASNEIMLELNQMSNLNLGLDIGEKIQVDIMVPIVDIDADGYMFGKYKEYSERKVSGNCVKTHIYPFEQIGDVGVVVDSNYVYCYAEGEPASPEVIVEKGVLEKQRAILKKEFIITGIIQTYTDKWHLEDNKAPNAYITKEAGEEFINAFYNTSLYDFSDYEMKYNMFLYSNTLGEETYFHLLSKIPILQSEETATYFLRNLISYPEYTSSTEYVLGLTIIAVIFIATALAILQIFLTQMKRRSRKIVLLKSIGATKSQIIKMIFYEGLYFLRSGLLIGTPIGLGTVALIIFSLNKFGGKNLQFYIEPSLFLLGLIAGVLALFVGMLIPTIYAISIPLVGTMSKPPKHKKTKRKEYSVQNIPMQNFSNINKEYLKLNKSKALISLGISFIAITILLTTIFLSYFAFDDYRNTVVLMGRPDYIMENYFADMIEDILETKEELLSIDGVQSAEYYKVGKQLFLWYEDIDNNKMIETYDRLLPIRIGTKHFSKHDFRLTDESPWISNAFYTKIYGIEPYGEVFNKYNLAITEGTVNPENFAKGDEIILLTPLYLEGNIHIEEEPFSREEILSTTDEDNRMKWLLENSGAYKTTYNGRYSKVYTKQDYIKPGDTIYLSSDNEKILDTGYSTEKIISHTTQEVKVGGIIHYFPRKGIWPFSNNVAPYVVISSIDGMESIYPNSKMGLFRLNLQQMKAQVNTISPYKFGTTLWHINTRTKSKDTILDAKLISYANNNKGYTLYNYKDSNSQLYEQGLNNALIISLLGITAAAIALIILYNTMVSKMEQDRNRIGILQSMGVTKEEFSSYYIKTGVLVGLLSLIIIHLILFLILIFTSMGDLAGFSLGFFDYIEDIFLYKLMDYPWILHLVVCIIYFIITVLIYYMPSRNITSKYPVENIRSLSR